MKVLAKTPVFYNGKRYEKNEELDIRKEAFDELLFENLEKEDEKKDTKEPKKAKE